MDRRDTERVIRMAITSGAEASSRVESIQKAMLLKGQQHSDLLKHARNRYAEAEKDIRDWAKRNEYAVTDAMVT